MGKRRRSAAAAVLALLLMGFLSACTLPGGEETPADVLSRSQETIASMRSLHYDTTLELSLSAQGQTMDMTTTTSVDYIADPVTMKLDFSVNLGQDLGEADTTLYLVGENGAAALYMSTEEDNKWTREETNLAELERYDAAAFLDFYLSSGEDFTQGEAETIQGAKTIRYDGVVAQEDLEKVLEASGMLEVLGQLSLDGQVQTGLSGLEPLPIHIWVEEETYYPIQCQLDLTGLMQLLMTQSFSDELGSIQITKALGTTTLGQINEVQGIQPPSQRDVVRGKCIDPDCNRDQAPTGESHYCTLHSATCLNCGKYIDQGELFCSSCTDSVLAQAQEDYTAPVSKDPASEGKNLQNDEN